MEKGTVNIRGKEYVTVARRVHDFRQLHSIADGWRIITHLISSTDDRVVMRAEIMQPSGEVVATGYAEEVRTSRGINANAALENCETSAIGRALAAAGYGGSQYASADELVAKIAGKNKPERQPTVEPELDHYGKFCRILERRGLDLSRVIRHCESKQWGRPETWSPVKRNRFLAALDAGTMKIP